MEDYNVVCEDCDWTGHHSQLICSEEDDKSKKPVSEIKFDCCPECGSTNVVDYDEDY